MTDTLTVEQRAALLARSAPDDIVALARDVVAELDVLVEEIERMCRRTEALLDDADREEWARLAPTAVSFEVLD